MKRTTWVLLALTILIACGGAGWLIHSGIGPKSLGDLSTPRVYAYRDWQSISLRLEPGDVVHLRARGEWLYTPGEYHGPEGHKTYPAPNTYPISGGGVPGGVLLGRIGEDGNPFIIGRGRTIVADRGGLLYLRINDDVLTDNEGYVAVEVNVEHPTPEDP